MATMEQAFEMVENLTEELIEKEDKIINLEKLVNDKIKQINDMKNIRFYYQEIRPKIMENFIEQAIANGDMVDEGEIYFQRFIMKLESGEYEEISLDLDQIIQVFDNEYPYFFEVNEYNRLFYIEIIKEDNEEVKIVKPNDIVNNVIKPICHKVLMGIEDIEIHDRLMNIIQDICDRYDWKELQIIRDNIEELGSVYIDKLFIIDDLFINFNDTIIERILNDIVAGFIDTKFSQSDNEDENIYNIKILGDTNDNNAYNPDNECWLLIKNIGLIDLIESEAKLVEIYEQ